MGVPYCFKWLKDKKKIVLTHNGNEIGDFHTLYFDWNCLWHPECFKILFANIDLKNLEKLERKMFQRIIDYTNYVIRFVCPTDYIYFAVDGVAPLAKIRQQRQRRFGYAHDYRKEIMDKYGIKYNDSWSNVVITPGTEFMSRLHSNVMNYYSKEENRHMFCHPTKNPNIKVLYSSYHIPGEGEHKILKDIKERFGEANKKRIAIYGLDADLIFLAMASRIDNIYLVREEFSMTGKKNPAMDPLDISETLVYADIDATKECINKTIRDEILNYNIVDSELNRDSDDEFDMYSYNEEDLKKISFVNDYILICFILGNDFLPHFPSVDLRRNGMELVISKYVETFYNNGSLIIEIKDGNVEFNNDAFAEFILGLARDEYSFFVDRLRQYMEREKRHTKCWESEKYKIDIWKKENLIGEIIKDDVMLGIGTEDDWKFRYYKHMGCEEHQDEFKDDLCKNYLEGISWVAKYYFTECRDWRWQYNYHHPPLISDLGNYIYERQKKKKFDMNSIIFDDKRPLPMFVQLLSVLPPKFNYLLPKTYRKLIVDQSPISDMYPVEYEVDKLYKSRLYQCVPLIPNLNVNRVIDCVRKLKLSKVEQQLSAIEEECTQLF